MSEVALELDHVYKKFKKGEIYDIGASCEITNLDLVKMIIDLYAKKRGTITKKYNSLIIFVPDRKGHDFRYAIDPSSGDVRALVGGRNQKQRTPK